MQLKTEGILELSLYVSDVDRSVRFYRETFGLGVISDYAGLDPSRYGKKSQRPWAAGIDRSIALAYSEANSWLSGYCSLNSRNSLAPGHPAFHGARRGPG
jgi:catechol 2,3-dioxygenase-like lactoylglutathione lyase family enzyme